MSKLIRLSWISFAALPAIGAFLIGGIFLFEWVRIGIIADSNEISKYYFGGDAMMAHGGWRHSSASTYAWSAFAEGMFLIILSIFTFWSSIQSKGKKTAIGCTLIFLWFVVSQLKFLQEVKEMEWMNLNTVGILIPIASAIAAIASAYYAHKSAMSAESANRTAESARIYQVLADVLMEYRSAEMLHGVRALWDFYRKHMDDLVDAYQAQFQQDSTTIANLPPDKTLDAEKATLHFKRRLVSQFYQLLAGLYELNVIPKHILYTYWSEGDLRIIPKILMPLEISLAMTLRNPSDSPGLKRLQKLYDDSKN